MDNNRGTILTVTLAFVLIFSLSGVALMRHATLQNEATERRTHSVKSLWIADSGVELARSKLAKPTPQLIPEGDPVADAVSLGEGSYYVYSEKDPDCPTCIDRWRIRSQALVHKHDVDGAGLNSRRGIDAIVAAYDIRQAVTTHGTINGSCISDCEANVDFTFGTVFNGWTFSDFVNEAVATPAVHPGIDPPHHAIHLNSSLDPFEVGGVTVLFLEDPLYHVTINTDDPAVYLGPSLLIVDSRGYTGPQTPEITINGAAGLCGILWSIGEATINGNSIVRGAVFIDGDPLIDNEVAGTGIAFNPACVDTVISSFGGTGKPGLIAWKEISL
jgi:hypothetical protein